MKFIADANIPLALIERLSREGFDIVDVRKSLAANSSDDEVFSEAIRQQRTIISRDKHFANLLLYPPSGHYGVIILRTRGLDTGNMTDVLIRFLRESGSVDYQGAICILENKKYRKRT